MQRGVSPLISIVLLVGLVVALGVVAFAWAIGFVSPEALLEPFQNDIQCSQVDIKILSTCYKDQDDTVYYTLENTRELEISKFLVNMNSDVLIQEEIEGLRSFGIDSYSFSQDGFDAGTLESITIIPYILDDNLEISCPGASVENSYIECCIGSCLDEDGQACEQDIDCIGGDVCNEETGECLQCLVDGDCESGTCLDNECVEDGQATSCQDLSGSVFVFATSGQCLQDSDVLIDLEEIDFDNLDELRIELHDASGVVHEDTLAVTSSSLSVVKSYGIDINTNTFLRTLKVIPRVNGEDCTGVEQETALYKILDEVALCCDSSVQCESLGEPGGNTCCEVDCGLNAYLQSSLTTQVETFDDLCIGDVLGERTCDDPATPQPIDCLLETGALGCTIDVCDLAAG